MIGRTISHHRILFNLSEDGMVVIYKAWNLHLDLAVAIKGLPIERILGAHEKVRNFCFLKVMHRTAP
jgi:hypothetical protein